MLCDEGVDEADDGLLLFLSEVLQRLKPAEQADVGELSLVGARAGDEVIGQALGNAAARGVTALARAVNESATAKPTEGGGQSMGNAVADEIVVTANLPLRWAGSRTSAMGISLGLYSLEERIDLDVEEGRRSPAQAAQAKIIALAYKQSLADEASANALSGGRTAARVDAEGRPYVITDQSGGFALTQGTLTGWTQGYMARFDAGLNAPDGKAEFLDSIAHNRDLVRGWDAQAYAAIDGSIIGVSRFAASTAIAPLGVADLAYSVYSGETTVQQLLAGSAVGLAATLVLHKPVGALTAKFGAAETAAVNGGSATGRQVLYHYTNEAGAAGIVDSASINPSLWRVGTKDVRYGNGQYVSDLVPGTKTPGQLSREFLGRPFHGDRFTHYIEIDATGLGAIQGRPGVYVIPNEVPLDLTGRLLGSGRVPVK